MRCHALPEYAQAIGEPLLAQEAFALLVHVRWRDSRTSSMALRKRSEKSGVAGVKIHFDEHWDCAIVSPCRTQMTCTFDELAPLRLARAIELVNTPNHTTRQGLNDGLGDYVGAVSIDWFSSHA